MIKMYHFIVCGAILFSCATPCPKDIKAGSVNINSETTSFIPVGDNINPVVFVNKEGKKITFRAYSSDVNSKARIPIETLCSKGEFLDKTEQTRYIEVPSTHLNYNDDEQKYTLALDIGIQSIGTSGKASDTVFVEEAGAWMQKLDGNAQHGSVSLMTSDRGRSGHRDVLSFKNSTNDYRIIPDTTILGKRLTNAYVNVSAFEDMRIFLEKGKNVQAFTTKDGEVWIRK
jgi:hypothetical protein